MYILKISYKLKYEYFIMKNYKKIDFNTHLKIEYNVDRTLFASFNRLLAKHEIQEGLGSHRQRELLTDNIMNKNMKNALEHPSTYGQLNKSKNDLDSYMRGYKRRYSKKNGLGKLDCYFEKKVFDKIDDLHNLVEKMQNDKKSLKKKIWKKYGIFFILLSLIPLFGLIKYIVYYGYLKANYECFHGCNFGNHKKSEHGEYKHDDDVYARAPIYKETWGTIEIVNFTLLCVSSFIVISVVIYIFIKFIKYQRLKACRSKMSIKEYCKFCKSIFI
ncbi:hypothetical protein PVMG_05924 [Plasmodium vivax Mauritania I]|uniref:Variable surface protein n=1 Tax=Plasmodium vivax Mauritania I TaxID=1035515 RepID=A0A0J9T3G2_PLAVI|nr:hypothetical protein PVMG_05924 [Plasmodium vivax Mauritania I]